MYIHRQKLLGGGVSTQYPVFCMIGTIDSKLKSFPDLYHQQAPLQGAEFDDIPPEPKSFSDEQVESLSDQQSAAGRYVE
eukprot:CAMPEP_0179421316 /NCGR_PEP_ID=MMETSP0799-20121207/9698_1 /TAXON_ID=46947 /ORGANISM="Geminigera cryophila, Strain CCMP2564" /LENGTH=78 /DNA_ID=CAMNT_0021195109 /DNA_START=39 /DNA_END=272 /DNA_ORIENTATION=-